MKCVVVFFHSTVEEQVREVLDSAGCRHYVGVNRAFARDDEERRLDSRYHPGSDVMVMAFVEDERVSGVTDAIRTFSSREHAPHTRVAVLPVEQFV